MVRWKTFLLSCSTLFILSGCGGISYIGYNQKQLLLQLDNNQLILHGALLAQKRDNFSSLFLSQNIIQLDTGETVVFEDARTDLTYEFDPMITRIVKIVFEAASISTVYARNNLFAYQVYLDDGRLLNVLAQQSDTQDLKLVYGMSTAHLNSMLRELDPNALGAYEKRVVKLPRSQHAILTKWDVRKVHFVPLVVPIGRFMGPF